MANALEVINTDDEGESIFINIFGGITKGEEVANGIVQALDRVDIACADRHPPRRHQRRAGPRDPRSSTSPTSYLEAHDGRAPPKAAVALASRS